MASDLHPDAPLFFEALAEAAKCSVPDAIEHFAPLESKPFPVDTFLTEYVAHA